MYRARALRGGSLDQVTSDQARQGLRHVGVIPLDGRPQERSLRRTAAVVASGLLTGRVATSTAPRVPDRGAACRCAVPAGSGHAVSDPAQVRLARPTRTGAGTLVDVRAARG